MKKICFFARVSDEAALQVVEFYKQDITILHDLGYDVKIATKWSDIDWSCDIVFIWWWTWAFFPVFISKILKKVTVITGVFNFKCPDADIDYFRRPWYQRMLIRYSVKNATKNIFVSEREMASVKNYWNLRNCEYSPCIIQTDIYKPLEKGTRKNDMLLSVCWLQKTNMRRKCIFEMIDVVELLVNRDVNIYYYIAGRKGDGLAELEEYIKNKNLEKNVLLLGEIDENKKISLMQECTIYFQISKYEGFGLAIAEAMSCGAPVITSDVGEVSNVVGNAGVVCNTYDINEIAEKIVFLIENQDKREEISKASRSRILENYQYNRRLKDMERYISLL